MHNTGVCTEELAAKDPTGCCVQAIAVSAPLLVKQRKLLKNILVMHGSLDILLDVIELTSGQYLWPLYDVQLSIQGKIYTF